ncbi:uncharacterized protein SAPINGB_P001885 [Magnusiomyces paraingens]|uniref:Uncharacterized protein n=1 Tax=Magnusiomyces paraingens TaxID=2606893 RepID=A0A5E8BIX4_9ASCO|nr:uncharacterized protein SAPINGB_P001885 [Saprochaete ingens]VVT48654.1 unnamed protein product [Saprochaete ingens]
MNPLPPKGPTPGGRAIAGIVGFSLSSVLVYYLFSDYQLIKKEPPRIEYDENGNPIKSKFRVSFQEMKPLHLKPEALDRIKHRQEVIHQQEERLKEEETLLHEQEKK